MMNFRENTDVKKLCTFFNTLFKIEREQGQHNKSVAVVQKYINKEIDIDELGSQLRGNTSKASLPETLMTSLRLHIDDLRREMFYGRVEIDGISRPPASVINLTTSSPITAVNVVNVQQPIVTQNIRLPTVPPLNNIQRPQQQITNQMTASVTPSSSNRRFQSYQQNPIASSSQSLVCQQTVTSSSAAQLNQQPPPQIVQQQQQAVNFKAIPHLQSLSSPNIRQPANHQSSVIQIRTSSSNASLSNNASVVITPSHMSKSIVPTAQTRQNIQSIVASTNIRAKSVPPANNSKINSAVLAVGDNSAKKLTEKVPETAESIKKKLLQYPGLQNSIINIMNYYNKVTELFKTDTNNNNVSVTEEALSYLSEAVENFSSSLLEQAAVYACHRHELFINDPMYKKIDDVRSQMKFLKDIDDQQRASEEERHKAELFRAAKSRSTAGDNQEQQKLRETVRQMQEHDKNCDEYARANDTAMKAIGNKRKFFDDGINSLFQQQSAVKVSRSVPDHHVSNNNLSGSQFFIDQTSFFGKNARSQNTVNRFRTKRIILKDFQLVLDQDVRLKRFKTYKKIFSYGRY